LANADGGLKQSPRQNVKSRQKKRYKYFGSEEKSPLKARVKLELR
jgi:hypothetical protein